MGLGTDIIVGYLLRCRLRFVALANVVVRRHEDADDVFQQVVVSAIEHESHFVDEDHLHAWAIRTTRNKALDLAKKKQLKSLSPQVLALLENEADPENTDRDVALWSCLGKLTDSAKYVLKLRYELSQSVPEIAKQLHRTEEAVYQILSRSHRALKRCVEIEMHGELTPPLGIVSTKGGDE
jgi:RNA polymerase sigma factor (sigma-70 family)